MRRLIAACAEVQSTAYGDFGEFETFLDEAETKVFKVVRNRRETATATREQIADAVMNEIERRTVALAEGGSIVTGARLGVTALDEATSGLQPGNLACIGARPGDGKTAVSLQAANNVCADGGSALFISLEMSAAEIYERSLCNVGRVNSQLVRRGQLDPEAWAALTAANSKLLKTSLVIEDTVSTLPGILSAARRWRNAQLAEHKATAPADAKDPPGLVVVDFLQLITGEQQRGQNRAQEVGGYAKALKALARELKVPVVMISQLNRQGARADRPTMLDLRDSGDIEAACDLILLLWISEEEREQPEPTAQIIVEKFRNGPHGFSVPARFIGRHYRFVDVEWRS